MGTQVLFLNAKRVVLIPVLLTSFLFVSNVSAEDTRGTLKVPLVSIYTKMLDAAETGGYNKIKNAIKLIDPIIKEIEETTKVDLTAKLQKAVESQDNEKMHKTVQQTIALGIKSLLEISHKNFENTAAVKTNIKQAFKEYLLLDPFIEKADFKTSKDIKMNFRKVNASFSKSENYVAVCNKITTKLEKVLEIKIPKSKR